MNKKYTCMRAFKHVNNILLALALVNCHAFGQASTQQNYVLTNTVKQTGITTEASVNTLPIATQGKTQTVDYFDGLGRPMENVVTQGSATQHDLITGMEYDSLGRQVKRYLTYSDIGNSSLPGGYRPDWKVVQSTFYSAGMMTNVDTSTAPFSFAVLEPSPLNRIAAQGAPGTTWQPNISNPYDPTSHAVQFKYGINVTGDSIRYFTINSAGVISSSGYYAPNTIIVKVFSDEQQQTVKEYKDLSGHVVLKRVLLAADSIQTYYIYDSLSMLRSVIQPEGLVVLKKNNWIFPANFQSQWMFIYRYDERERMVMKKIPGADSVNMLYDQWDRLVLTQDGNLRVNHFWLFTKYDQLNRAVVSGQITDTRALSALQTDVANSTGRFESVSTSATEGYTLNNTFPSSGTYTLTVYTTTHYDSYANLPTAWGSGYNFVNEFSIAGQNSFLNGQVVATQARVLGASNFYRSVFYYDDKYRTIQITTDNAAGGKDRITKILSFDGKVINDYHSHTSRFFTTANVIKQVCTYDHVDRLLTSTHQTNAQEVVTINQSVYNELGQLLNKKIHQSPSHPNALQKLDFYYNIRGWLNSINRPVTSVSGYEESDLFNEELHYNTNMAHTGSIPNYNGNIAEEVWKGGYDEYYKCFAFSYDGSNRLANSQYSYQFIDQYGPEWNSTKKYNEESITYDHNGNLITLSRFHGSYNTIDALNYKNYSGNQVGYVDDYSGSTSPVGFQNKSNGGNDYTYDPNGNMTMDYNKGITSISYNYLNLPNVVTINSQRQITYTYDAAGNKLQKSVLDSGKTRNYYYAGDYVYRSGTVNDTLEFISHPEGRLRPVRIDTTLAISPANLKYIYDYYIKDHLGSVRSVLTTEQETDLYAATMETAAATKENLLFSNVGSTAVAKPGGFDTNGSNGMVSQLNGNVNVVGNKRVGLSIILKVMAGDTVSISAYGWYTGTTQAPATGVGPIVNDLLPLLTNGIVADGGSKGGAIPYTTYNPLITAALDSFLQYMQPYDNTRPKAYLNWMVVDEEFAKVRSVNHAGAIQMPLITGAMQAQQMLGPTNMVIRRNGYLYVYLSNESNQNVDFDNLVVNQRRGPLVEQKDYYAFGMEIPGLSSKAFKPNYNVNRLGYNGKELQSQEFSDSSGLSWDDYGARMYDPQIGRWSVIDPMTEKSRRWTSYAYACDNPIRYMDPDGMNILDGVGGQLIQDFHSDPDDKSASNSKTSPVNTDIIAGDPANSAPNLSGNAALGDKPPGPGKWPPKKEIDECKTCILPEATKTAKMPKKYPTPYNLLSRLLVNKHFDLNNFFNLPNIIILGNTGSTDYGSKMDPNKDYVVIGQEELELLDIAAFYAQRPDLTRPPLGELAIYLAKKVLEAEPDGNQDRKPTYFHRTIHGGPAIHGVLRNSDGTWRQYDAGSGPDTTHGNGNTPDTISNIIYDAPKPLHK
jgi:RHS repeat-associated protein